ncbi:MAG: ester cyclase, partial [Alphaproteobacteria bacterium]
ADIRTSFPDLAVAVERVVEEGDTLVAHIKLSGTHLGDFMGAAPSGKTFAIEGIDIVRMDSGRITEHWGVMDEAAMARQLGLGG